jgi:aminoglycoside 2'-N-acetyltransferase I
MTTNHQLTLEILPDAKASKKHTQILNLLILAFEGDFSDGDWRNSCGGVRIIGCVDGEIVAHAAVVSRKMLVNAVEINVGYVEGLAVHPSFQGLGFGKQIVQNATELCLANHVLSLLSTDEHTLYESAGWQRFRGESFVSEESGLVRTSEEDGGLMFLAALGNADINPRALVCFERAGEPW